MSLLDRLQTAGLTKREAHVYLALLQKKEFAASEISSIVPVGRTKIYEIIPSLLAKGLCRESHKNGKKIYSAIEPQIALQNILNHFQNEFEELFDKKKKLIKDLETSLVKIYDDNATKSERIDYIEILNERNQIKNRWIELQKGIKKELLGFNKAPYTLPLKQNIPYQKNILKRKIKSKGIYELAELTSDTSLAEFIETIQAFVKLGEECRITKELPMKMMIIDEKITMLALIDPVSMKNSITTMIVTHPNFAQAQKQVFESYWDKAVPFTEFVKNPLNILVVK
jgi:sugar-specific transcriptional regulator TrmB